MPTLREWRYAKSLSIEGLAKAAGVSTKTISDIENGKVHPKFRTMRRVCTALGIEPGEVAEFAAPKKGSSDAL